MFNTQFHPIVGGAERQLELLCRALDEARVRVTVLTFQQERSWPLREQRSGFEIVRIPHLASLRGRWDDPRASRVQALLQGARLAGAVARLAPRFDVLHAHNASTPYTAVAVRVARALGLGTVVKAVNSGEWFDLTRLEADSAHGPRARRWLLADVERWIAVSEHVAEDLAAASVQAERIVRLPNGVATEGKQADIPERARHFLHVGRLARTAPRDVAGLLRAFESVPVDPAGAMGPAGAGGPAGAADPAGAAGPAGPAELVVVGGGERLEELRALAARSPARERIRLVGEQEAAPWLQWAHVLVHPSFAEGMSNALLEGMAAGLACVAYDIPPNRETLGEALTGSAGELVPVGDVAALAGRLTALASQPGRARRLGRLARERAVAEFRIESVRDRLLGVYAELVS
jgi:glycosyltransferase involved in cell wall biosynthesis